MTEKIGEFFTKRGFHYRGKLILETDQYYRILDFKTNKEIDIFKDGVETASWSEVK